MYKYKKTQPTTLKVSQAYEGETIEQKVDRYINNKAPITDGAPLLYTERKEGVLPQYNIRSDRFEIGVDSADKLTKSRLAKREERHKAKVVKMEEKPNETNKIGGPEPAQGTGNEPSK